MNTGSNSSWWHHSRIYQALALLTSWVSQSWLLNSFSLEILLGILVAALPFWSNEQLGILSLVIGIFTLPFWLQTASAVQLPLACYWLVAAIATLQSPVKIAALDGWIKLSLFLGVFFGFQVVCRRRRSLLIGVYVLTCLVVMIYGVRQWVYGVGALATWVDPSSDFAGTTRIFSFLDNPNLLAGYLLPCFPVAVVAAIVWRGWGVKLLSGAIALLGMLGVVLTFSRGGLIGLGLELVVLGSLLLFWWQQQIANWIIIAIGGLALTLSSTAFTLIPALRLRLLSIFVGRADSSNNFRINVWLAVLEMVKSRPILGIGPGNKAFNLVYPFYQRPGFSALGAYSVPLEIASETGLVGLGIYLWFLVTLLKTAWHNLLILRSQRQAQGLWLIAALSSLVGLIGQGLFDTVWYRPQVQIVWWLLVGIIASCDRGLDQSFKSTKL
ncbi:MAG: IctB family putative bicarbonate transporter [Pseudanabaenaceae cyanobacterium bins.68]|nr:IctB family putative bicarbonate transporter [Pseudanabaenaceae cyanobacterium bins.68]